MNKPALYAALGVFLPLITTNCAVLGVAIIVAQKDFGLMHSVVYAVATAIGFVPAVATAITKVTAILIPKADSRFFETPIKGQMPKNWANTILLTNMAEKLIVVNCILLGRAEAFASKNGVLLSLCDGVGVGIGFTIALTILGAVRESGMKIPNVAYKEGR